MLDAPSIALLLVAAITAGVAAYLGLFQPLAAPSATSGSGDPSRHATPAPQIFFVGAFAVYTAWMLAGLLIQALSGQAPAASDPSPASPSIDLAARTQGLMLLLAVPSAVATFWWVHRGSSRPVRFELAKALPATLVAFGWAFVTLPFVFAIGMTAKRVSESLGQPVDQAAHSTLKMIVDDQGSLASRVVLIACAVIGAPILEELCYRGLFQRGITAVTRSHWAGVLITSTLFTAMHIGVIPSGSFWPAASMLFSLSMLLGLLLARTGSVITTIVIHGLFNAANIAMALSSQGNA